MPHAYYYDVPSTPEMYRAVIAEMGAAPRTGMISHLVVRYDQGLRHFGVWESRADWEQYRDSVVRPAVARVLSRAGIAEPPLPEEHQLEIVEVQTN